MGKMGTGYRSLMWAGILCALLAGWLGCSEEKHYKTLSFFFDGVPDPNARRITKTNSSGDPFNPTPGVTYIHKPFAEGKCGVCHGSDDPETMVFRPVETIGITSSVCLKCHGKIPNQYPVMHGPVALGECLLCHTPHESSNPALLSYPPIRLCVQCHVPELLTPRPLEHTDGKTNCIQCHFGHGGPKHDLLRPATTTRPAPTTAPSPAGSGGGR